MQRALFLMIIALWACPLPTRAQTSATAEKFSVSIEDNSFFVEEAFNQEERVVQHIFNGLYYRRPLESAVTTFTQEWPLFGPDHQFSYSIAYNLQAAPGSNGFGDTFLNYRYQLLSNEAWAAFAPRLSLILPTGNTENGLGFGVVGGQLNLPFSKRLSNPFIIHWNVGITLFPNVQGTNAAGQPVRHTLPWYNLATSLIWLFDPNANIMLEAAINLTSDFDDNGEVAFSREFIISPGFRGAINLQELQIVPGIAVPLSIVDGEQRIGVLFYLSFEHPF